MCLWRPAKKKLLLLHAIGTLAGRDGERLERSLPAVVVALGSHWWRKGETPATTTALSRLLDGALRPESVNHLLWQARTFLWGEDGPVVAVDAERPARGYRLALREGEALAPGLGRGPAGDQS